MNKLRRLPGPACCRLSEGDHPPEALYELFRDWQRTQTQSSVMALRSPRQQMDVWFCRAQEPMPGGIGKGFRGVTQGPFSKPGWGDRCGQDRPAPTLSALRPGVLGLI